MIAYQRDNKWYIYTDGGVRNNDRIPEEELGPLNTLPQPAIKWREFDASSYGRGIKTLTLFTVAGDKSFILEEYHWNPAYGYNANIAYEVFGEMREPPTLGEAFAWTNHGWSPIPHPQALDIEAQATDIKA